jgi:hypothetical protein
VLGHELLHDPELRGCGRGEPVSLVVGGCRVDEPLRLRQVDTHLVARGGGDEALSLDLLPRRVEPLRADEREDVALAAVFAYERRGEAEAPAGLQLGRELEHGRGQQVHLVVHDEAPVERVEQGEVGVLALPLRREDLVGRDRDGLDLLHLPRVLADLLGGERGAAQQLVAPLACRDGVRHEDERRGLRGRHRARADEGLARAARQHDDARAATEEVVDRLLLVAAQVPFRLVELDRMRRSGCVPGEVFSRPAELHELLLQLPAGPRRDEEALAVDPIGEQRRDALRARDLGEHGHVIAAKAQCPVIRAVDDEPAVPADGLAHVDGDGLRHRELRIPLEGAEHVVGVVAGGTGVPEAEPRDAVGVHVLGCALELCEDREIVPGIFGERVCNLEEHGAVALHDEGAV